MDLTVILGMVISVTSIAVGDIMEGGNPLHVLHITSFIIVVPTAMASAMTGTAPEYVRAAFKEFKVVFKKSPVDLHARIKQIIDFAIIARRDGIFTDSALVLTNPVNPVSPRNRASLTRRTIRRPRRRRSPRRSSPRPPAAPSACPPASS